jgi:hypothetical protein
MRLRNRRTSLRGRQATPPVRGRASLRTRRIPRCCEQTFLRGRCEAPLEPLLMPGARSSPRTYTFSGAASRERAIDQGFRRHTPSAAFLHDQSRTRRTECANRQRQRPLRRCRGFAQCSDPGNRARYRSPPGARTNRTPSRSTVGRSTGPANIGSSKPSTGIPGTVTLRTALRAAIGNRDLNPIAMRPETDNHRSGEAQLHCSRRIVLALRLQHVRPHLANESQGGK